MTLILRSAPPEPPAVPTPTNSASQPEDPELLPYHLPWDADGKKKVWELINAIHKPEFFKVLFGTKVGENTSGLKKKAVHKMLAEIVWPEYWDLGGTTQTSLTKRVGGKIDGLISSYKECAKLLRKTGEGLGSTNDPDEAIFNDEANQSLRFYIPKDGPAADASEEVRNLWDKIIKKFEFFPAFHTFCCNRANMVPPAVTTGVGPQGRQTLHLQGPPCPPSRLPVRTSPTTTSVPPASSASSTPSQSSAGSGLTPSDGHYKFTRLFDAAQSQTSDGRSSRPPKRDLAEQLGEISQRQAEVSARRLRMDAMNSLRSNAAVDKNFILESVKVGLYSKEEARGLLDEINARLKRAERLNEPVAHQSPSTPSRRLRIASAPPEESPTRRQPGSSPTWGIERSGEGSQADPFSFMDG